MEGFAQLKKGIKENEKMDWSQVFTIIAANISIFFWLRTQSRKIQQETTSDQRNLLKLVTEIKDEIKEFHGRMCPPEKRHW